jgi:ATP-dependent Clp protease ATP-binding subunit ClpA
LAAILVAGGRAVRGKESMSTTNRNRKGQAETAGALVEALSERLVGQPDAVQAVAPFVQMFQAQLSPEGRPAGVFLLLGPTGTGKTRTVECLADVLHGNEKCFLKVDCGEFQMEHEVAKLIGAPPGYLGHRETQPMLTQAKLSAVTTERSGLSIVLFDEVEKAAPSLTRLLLGVLDKGILRLGDNTAVNFERSLIFLTSNLGAAEMMRELEPQFGFEAAARTGVGEASRERIEKIGTGAVRRKFSPEFVNRIDRVVAYQPLDREALERILDQQLAKLQEMIDSRQGARTFRVVVSEAAKSVLLDRGTSVRYGARELKRTIQRLLLQPLAVLVAEGSVPPLALVAVTPSKDGGTLELTVKDGPPRAAAILEFAQRARMQRPRRNPYAVLPIETDDFDAA